MTLSDGVMIFAVLLAPFLAVFAQKEIEQWREVRQRKLWVFKTLMATRGKVLSLEHVQALNMIDLEFLGKNEKEEEVRDAWKEYHDNLNSYPREGDNLEQRVLLWSKSNEELFTSLLKKMGHLLGYKFNSTEIIRGAYSPEGHATIEMELNLIRKMALECLAGERKVRISVVPLTDDDAARGLRLSEGLLGILEGQKELKIKIDSDTL